MIETFSGLPRKSSAIFGKFWEMFGNVYVTLGIILEIFGKWSEIFGKLSKTPSSVCLYNKKNITP